MLFSVLQHLWTCVRALQFIFCGSEIDPINIFQQEEHDFVKPPGMTTNFNSPPGGYECLQ